MVGSDTERLRPEAATGPDVKGQPGLARGVTTQSVGGYKILEVLGEGGMGTVFAAYDTRLDRKIALKLVRGGGSSQAQARMLREAKAMAKLSHPNVVPVFEVGDHEGELFIAMEFVDGQTLREWGEAKRPWREIVAKYRQAGQGLAAAHAQGLVHRDFKPDNVVVGADGRARVLDFGLAARSSALATEESRVTLREPATHDDERLTETGRVVGTPAYMATEQILGDRIDHRTDQFAFCVALWEGLCGVRPFGGDGRIALFDNVSNGRVEAPEAGDLPTEIRPILERGLRVEADDRWPDMASLLRALQRGSVDRSRRRRIGFGIGVAVLSGGVAVWGAAAYDDAQREARSRACRETARSEIAEVYEEGDGDRVSSGLLAVDVPHAEVTAANVVSRLEAYAQSWMGARTEVCADHRVREQSSADDFARATWCLEDRRLALGELVDRMQAADTAAISRAVVAAAGLASVERCRDPDLLGRLPPPPPAEARAQVQEVRRLLARANASGALGQYDAAIADAERAVEQAERLGQLGLLAAARGVLGLMLSEAGKFPEAEAALSDAYFEAAEAKALETAASVATSLTLLVGHTLGRHDDGRHWSRLAQTALVELGLGDESLERATLDANRAKVDFVAGDNESATRHGEQALAIRDHLLGPDHPATAGALNVLGGIQYGLGKYPGAAETYGRVLEIQQRALAPDHPSVAQTLENLGLVQVAQGDIAGAIVQLDRALAMREDLLGPMHPSVGDTLASLATAHATGGDLAAAKPLFERGLSIQQANLEPNPASLAMSHNNLAIVNGALGDLDGAKKQYEQALVILESAVGAEHADYAKTLANLANLQQATGAHEIAIEMHARALEIRRRALGAEHPDVGSSLNNLAVALGELGRHSQAAEHYAEAVRIRRKALGQSHPVVALTLANLGGAHEALGDLERARTEYQKAVEIFEAEEGTQPGEPEARFGLAKVLVAGGGDRSIARQEAEDAAAIFKAAGAPAASQLAEVEAWLARWRASAD